MAPPAIASTLLEGQVSESTAAFKLALRAQVAAEGWNAKDCKLNLIATR